VSNSLRATIGDFIESSGKPDAELDALMRAFLVDYLIVAHKGMELPSSVSALRATRHKTQTQPEHASAIWGSRSFAGAEDAAFINGVSAHGLELDDTYEPSSLHPGVVVFSAALALAQERNLTWADTVRAAVIGYDVMSQVGVYVGSKEMYGRGFHPTGVAGAWGSAATWAALASNSRETTENALSLAANMAAGSLEFLGDGSWTKRLNAGHAAAVGIRAGELASAGFTGPATALEGRNGFAVQYGRGPNETRDLTLEFGQSAKDTSIKFFPCCRYMHGVMDLLSQYRSENPGLDLNSIESIDAVVITAGRTLVADPPEMKTIIATPVDAQFSMPFGAIAALALDDVTAEVFDQAPSYNDRFVEHMKKVRCISNDAIDAPYPQRWSAAATIRFIDGRVVELHEDSFVGSPGNPASPERLHHKGVSLVGEETTNAITAAVAALKDDTLMNTLASFSGGSATN
jgi:2-methylcitrate dehydratase PrpD